MIDLNLVFRGGDSFTKYDDKNASSTVGNAGNLNATFTSSWIDVGASLKQIPMDGLAVLISIPQSSITTTGAPTSFSLVAKVDASDDSSTVLSTVQSQTLTFTVTSNAASAFTYSKDGTASTSVNLPQILKLNLPYTVHEFYRLTLTLSFSGGTSPALNATGFGKVNAWLDESTGAALNWVEIN